MHPEIQIGDFVIKSYVLFNFVLSTAVSFGVMLWLSYALFKEKAKLWKIAVLMIGGFISAVAIARLSHYIVFHKMYDLLGLSVVNTTASGYILFTALILNIPVIWALSKLVGYSPLAVLDIAKAGNCFSIFIAKIGCFLDGCCIGTPTNLPWGVTFPGTTVAVHPVQLYESAYGLIAGIVFIYLLKKQKLPQGAVFLIFASTYSLVRLVMFYLRATPIGASYTEAAPFVFLALGFGFIMWLTNRLKLSEKY